MTNNETLTKNKINHVKIMEKVKATKFGIGPEYKFLFKIDSVTNPCWQTYFSESLPEASLHLLEEVKPEKKARYKPVYFRRSELEIVCIPDELNSILSLVKKTIALANEKHARYQAQLLEGRNYDFRNLKATKEEETQAEEKIQNFFAELEI